MPREPSTWAWAEARKVGALLPAKTLGMDMTPIAQALDEAKAAGIEAAAVLCDEEAAKHRLVFLGVTDEDTLGTLVDAEMHECWADVLEKTASTIRALLTPEEENP